MSWAFLDDHADENPKLMAAGGEAAWYWACGLCYCRRNPKVPGFIPRQKARLLYEVKDVDAVIGRLLEVRLWEEVPGGYQVNDYGKIYKTDTSPEELSTKRAEAGRLGGLAKASKRGRVSSKPASNAANEPPSKEPESDVATEPPESGKTDSKNLASAGATRARVTREDPTPTPTFQPDTTTQDLTGQSAGRGDIPCPRDLRLTPDQRATLEVAGVPPWAIDVLTAQFVASSLVGSDPRPFNAWLKCLSKAVMGDWNNPNRRPKPESATRPDAYDVSGMNIKLGAEGLS